MILQRCLDALRVLPGGWCPASVATLCTGYVGLICLLPVVLVLPGVSWPGGAQCIWKGPACGFPRSLPEWASRAVLRSARMTGTNEPLMVSIRPALQWSLAKPCVTCADAAPAAQTKPNQIRSDQIRSDQIRSDSTRSDESDVRLCRPEHQLSMLHRLVFWATTLTMAACTGAGQAAEGRSGAAPAVLGLRVHVRSVQLPRHAAHLIPYI